MNAIPHPNSRNRAVRILFALGILPVALSLSTMAQQHAPTVMDQWTTQGRFNGRFWQDATVAERRYFIFGYQNATEFQAMLLTDGLPAYEKQARRFLPPLTGAEMIESLDRMYADPANRVIDIPTALQIIAMRSNGRSDEDIQKLIAKLRESLNH